MGLSFIIQSFADKSSQSQDDFYAYNSTNIEYN